MMLTLVGPEVVTEAALCGKCGQPMLTCDPDHRTDRYGQVCDDCWFCEECW